MLTSNQLKVLRFIFECRVKQLISPTHREIAEALNMDKKYVSIVLQALVDKKLLRKEDSISRSLQLTELAYELLQVNTYSSVSFSHVKKDYKENSKLEETSVSTKSPNYSISYGSEKINNTNGSTANKIEDLISSAIKFFNWALDGSSPQISFIKSVVRVKENSIYIWFLILLFIVLPVVVKNIGRGSDGIVWSLFLSGIMFFCYKLTQK